MSNKSSGDIGEQEVVDLVPCPNCGNRLMLLPPSPQVSSLASSIIALLPMTICRGILFYGIYYFSG